MKLNRRDVIMLYAETLGKISLGDSVKANSLKTDFISHFLQNSVYCGEIAEGGTDGGLTK